MKNSKISVFRKANDTTPAGAISIYNFLTIANEQERKAIDYIRSIPAPVNEEEKEFLQAEKLRLLGCATISGFFSVRSESGLISHSGSACIDLDLKDNLHVTNWATLKDQLKNIENIAYCGLSVSGRGYFCVIPIVGQHKGIYEALVEAFRLLGLKADRAPSNVSACRYKSYDDAPYINEAAIPFSSVFPKVRTRAAISRCYTDSDTERQIALIEKIEIDITEEYADWVKIGFAFANHFGEEGRAYFHRVSRFNAGYDTEACDKQFDSCLRSDKQQRGGGGITIRHFFGRCKEAGLSLKLADFD